MSQTKPKKYAKRRQQNTPWLPILLAAGGLLLILGAAFVFSQSSKPKATLEVSGSPSLKADREEMDFGNVKLGETVQVSFVLTNVGDQPIRFSEAPYIEVKEGC